MYYIDVVIDYNKLVARKKRSGNKHIGKERTEKKRICI